MIQLLKEYKEILLPSGRCLKISSSYIEENLSFVDSVRESGKKVLKKVLGIFGLYNAAIDRFLGLEKK